MSNHTFNKTLVQSPSSRIQEIHTPFHGSPLSVICLEHEHNDISNKSLLTTCQVCVKTRTSVLLSEFFVSPGILLTSLICSYYLVCGKESQQRRHQTCSGLAVSTPGNTTPRATPCQTTISTQRTHGGQTTTISVNIPRIHGWK